MLAWPIAILALVLAPFVLVFGWLLMLPFRLIGILFDAAGAPAGPPRALIHA